MSYPENLASRVIRAFAVIVEVVGMRTHDEWVLSQGRTDVYDEEAYINKSAELNNISSEILNGG